MIDKKNMKTQCTRLIHAYGTHCWSEKNKTQIDKTQADTGRQAVKQAGRQADRQRKR